MPPAPTNRRTGVRALPLAVCIGIALLVVAAGASQGASFGPTRKVAKTVDIGPQIQGTHLSWMDVELRVRQGERVEWDWYADGPLCFYIVSPTGLILATEEDRRDSAGSAVMPAAGTCRASWTNPSFRTPVKLSFSVEVTADRKSVPSSSATQGDPAADDDWQWVSEVAVALLLLLGLEVMVTVPMLVFRLRAGHARSRTCPVEFVDAYIGLGPEEPVGPAGLPVCVPLRPRPMEGALSVARVARR